MNARKTKECWIFGSGEAGNVIVPENVFIIAADGGLRHVLSLGLTPDLILGDFDSYDGGFPENCEKITAPPEKDDTDMLLAVKTALKRGYYDITLCGALGGRLDHTIANIQTLEYILNRGGHGRIVSEKNTAVLQTRGKKRYEKAEGCYFSIFSLTEAAIITSRGTKYDLTDHVLDRDFPLGVSNEIISPAAFVEVKDGTVLIVFSAK